MTAATERPDRFLLSEPSLSWTPRFPGNRILLAEAGTGRVYGVGSSSPQRIWEGSATLRSCTSVLGRSDLDATVDFLVTHKSQIDAELGRTTSYNQLIMALLHGGRIQGNLQNYQRTGGALDLYNLPGNPMQQLETGQFKTPQEAARWLTDHKPELDRLAQQVDQYSYGTLIMALFYAGKVSGKLQSYMRAGASLDFYYTGGNPMQGLLPGQFKKPEEAIQWLMDHKTELDQLATKVDTYSYATLIYALTYTGKVSGSTQPYQRAASSLDLYNLPGNPMQQLETGQFKTPQEAARWLIDHKLELDRLAKQVDEYSYGTLMAALVYARKISADHIGSSMNVGGALQYLAKKWDEIGPLIHKSYRGERLEETEKARFTTLTGEQTISKGYRVTILQVGRFLIREGLLDKLLGRTGGREGGGGSGPLGEISYRRSAEPPVSGPDD
ncbi:MAG: hypothetical protein Q7S98_03300, partial [Deltaproteobacteria bacterium]|nr:hypothetical protein [Deltaproteobacteria bacterium]